MATSKYVNCGVTYLSLKQESIDNLNELLANYNDDKLVVLCNDSKTINITLPFFEKKHENNKVLWISLEFPPVELSINPDKLILVGVDKITDEQQFILDDHLIEHYTLDKMIKIGVPKIMEIIKETIVNNKVHLVIDPIILSKLNPQELLDPLSSIVSTLDLINLKNSNEEIFRLIIAGLKISNKTTINLFNEDSYFLVYRPMIPLDNTDTGWYILRGVSVSARKEMLSHINEDQIITIELGDDDDEYLVSKTTINKQLKLSYHAPHTIYDLVLFPEEKQMMHFELISKY